MRGNLGLRTTTYVQGQVVRKNQNQLLGGLNADLQSHVGVSPFDKSFSVKSVGLNASHLHYICIFFWTGYTKLRSLFCIYTDVLA